MWCERRLVEVLPYISVLLNSRDNLAVQHRRCKPSPYFPVRVSRVRGGGSMQVLVEGHIHPVLRKPSMGSASSIGSALEFLQTNGRNPLWKSNSHIFPARRSRLEANPGSRQTSEDHTFQRSAFTIKNWSPEFWICDGFLDSSLISSYSLHPQCAIAATDFLWFHTY